MKNGYLFVLAFLSIWWLFELRDFYQNGGFGNILALCLLKLIFISTFFFVLIMILIFFYIIPKILKLFAADYKMMREDNKQGLSTDTPPEFRKLNTDKYFRKKSF